jgi:hypothetical protein
MAREYLMMVEESSYGNPALTTGAPTTGRFMWIRLDEDNSFSLRQVPDRGKRMWGGGLAVPGQTYADTYTCKGSLRVALCYSQADRLFKFCTTRVNTGRTAPWVTTDAAGVMPTGDLASVSLYHAYQRSDSTFKLNRYAGVKANSWNFECSRESPVAMLSMELQAQRRLGNPKDSSTDPTTTEFPYLSVNDSVYPTDLVLFSHSSTRFSVAGNTRSLYSRASLRSTHTMDPNFFESNFLQSLNFFGRSTTLECKNLLKASPDDRTAFESLTAQNVSLAFSNTTNTLTFTLNAKNYFDGIDDDFSMSQAYEQGWRIENYYDPAVGGNQPDLTVALS